MRIFAVLLAAFAAAGCSGGDDRLPILDQKFILAPGAKDTWTFIVYSEGPCFVETFVDVAGGAADVSIVQEERPPLADHAAAGVSGKKAFAGNLEGGAYRITTENRGVTPCQVHVLVLKHLEARP